MKKYFVSYIWRNFWKHGCGMCIVNLEKSMGTADGLIEAARVIAEDAHAKKLVILNYIEVDENDV